MKVRYSKLALAELDAILAHISANNPVAAQRFDRRLHNILERIAQFPESAQEVDERPGVRRVPLVRYPLLSTTASLSARSWFSAWSMVLAAILGKNYED